MGRSLDDVIQGLPAARRQRIESLADEKVQEMLAAARTLTDIRKAVGKTQANVAQELGIQQNAISQLERRSDTYLSTLRRFLKSLGLELELSVVSESGARYSLDNFRPWLDDDPAVNAAESVPTPAAKNRSNTERRRATARR
jgi:transcriptional regulator with XRE-family HTH domain